MSGSEDEDNVKGNSGTDSSSSSDLAKWGANLSYLSSGQGFDLSSATPPLSSVCWPRSFAGGAVGTPLDSRHGSRGGPGDLGFSKLINLQKYREF